MQIKKLFYSVLLGTLLSISTSSGASSLNSSSVKESKKINPLILHDIILNEKLSIDEKLEQIKIHCTAETINTPDSEGDSPLHVLCQHSENIPIIEFLIEQDANINAEKKNNSTIETPLVTALTCDEPKIAQILINAGAESSDFTLHNAAASDCHLEILKQLLTKQQVTNQFLDKLLQIAEKYKAENNSTEKITAFLTQYQNKEKFSEALKEYNKHDQDLFEALRSNSSLKGDELVNRSKQQNQLAKKITEQAQVIEKILEYPFIFQIPDQNGNTPYTLLLNTKYKTEAAETARKKLVESSPQKLINLVKYLAPIEKLNKKTDAEKILAEKEKLFKRIQTICKKHPESINSQDAKGNTALHYTAMLTNDPRFTNLLLDLGANPNIKNCAGSTAKEIKLTKRTLREQKQKEQSAAIKDEKGKEKEKEDVVEDPQVVPLASSESGPSQSDSIPQEIIPSDPMSSNSKEKEESTRKEKRIKKAEAEYQALSTLQDHYKENIAQYTDEKQNELLNRKKLLSFKCARIIRDYPEQTELFLKTTLFLSDESLIVLRKNYDKAQKEIQEKARIKQQKEAEETLVLEIEKQCDEFVELGIFYDANIDQFTDEKEKEFIQKRDLLNLAIIDISYTHPKRKEIQNKQKTIDILNLLSKRSEYHAKEIERKFLEEKEEHLERDRKYEKERLEREQQYEQDLERNKQFLFSLLGIKDNNERKKALKTLELSEHATEQEIKAKVRTLRRQYDQNRPHNQTAEIKAKLNKVLEAERILLNTPENIKKNTSQITDEEHKAHELMKTEQLKILENISSKEEIESSSKHASLANIDLDESPKEEDKDEEKELKETSESSESSLSESESNYHIPLAKKFAPVIAQSTIQTQTLKKPATVTKSKVQTLAKQEREKEAELKRISEQERVATEKAKSKETETVNAAPKNKFSHLGKPTPGTGGSFNITELKEKQKKKELLSSESSNSSTSTPAAEEEKKEDTTIRFDIKDLEKTDRITQARQRATRKKETEDLTQSFNLNESPQINERLKKGKRMLRSEIEERKKALQDNEAERRKEILKGQKELSSIISSVPQTTIEIKDDDLKSSEEQVAELQEKIDSLEKEATQLASEPQEKKEGFETLAQQRIDLQKQIDRLPASVQAEKDKLLTKLNSEVASHISIAQSSYQQTQITKKQQEIENEQPQKTKIKTPTSTTPKKKISLVEAFKAKQMETQQTTDKVEVKAEELQKKKEDEIPKQMTDQSTQEDLVNSEKPEQKEKPEDLQKIDQKIEAVLVDQENPENKKEEGKEQLTEENTPQNNTFKIGVLSVIGATAILGIGYKVKQCYDLYQALKAKELEKSTGANDKDLMLIAAKECLLPEQVIQWLEQKQRIEPDQEQKIESKEA